VNASRGLRSLAILVLATLSWATSQVACAGDAQPNHGAPPEAKSPPGKTDPATKTIAGRVFDAHGKPLADASVWLVREDDSDFKLPEVMVIAETQSRADGRFDLKPLVADLRKRAANRYADFGIWVFKRGLALGHGAFFGEPVPQPINIFLAEEVPFVVQLKTPKGGPCQGASVTPTVATFGYSRAIPKPLQDRLKTKSAPDGQVDIHGFDGRLKGLSIEKPEFGTQVLGLSDQATSPLVATLHETRALEGRLILPKGERVDPSQAFVLLEVLSDKMSPCKKEAKDQGDPPPFGFRQEFAPKVDRDGRFRVSGVLRHGRVGMSVQGFPDIPLVFAPSTPAKSPEPDASDGKMEIPLMKGIWCDVVIRDAQSKRPLPGIDFAIGLKSVVDGQVDCDEEVVVPDSDQTDNEGRIRLRVRPGETYRARCVPGDGYLDWSANNRAFHIPAGVDRFELPPIELTRACAIKGRLVDASGKPFFGVSILGAWSGDGQHDAKATTNATHWTTTDSAGWFRFEEIAAGTHVALLAVRGGVPFGDPVRTVAGDNKSIELTPRSEELVALSGRLLGLDHKPVAAAPLLVEIENASGAPTFFSVQTGADGAFRTAVCFPKRLKYRLIARLLLDVVGCSDWMCPAASGTTFPDFSVDATRLRIGTRLSGDEVVARVNGEPIRAHEILDWAFVQPLTQLRNLAAARKKFAAGRITEAKFRALQDDAINIYAETFACTRLRAGAFLAQLDAEERKALQEAYDKKFADYVEKLKAHFRVSTTEEVDRKLQQQGAASLASVRTVWQYTIIAKEPPRVDAADSDVLWSKALASYKVHADHYVTPAKVGCQLIEVNFYKPRPLTVATASTSQTDNDSSSCKAKPDFELRFANNQNDATKLETRPEPPDFLSGIFPKEEAAQKNHTAKSPHAGEEYVGRTKAYQVLEKAREQLRKGESFEAVAKKFSEGPGAEQGGWQTPVRPDSVADAKTAAALRELPEGATSSIIETDDSLRIVRVVSRIPASVKPFEEVEEAIRESVRRDLQKKEWHALLARSSIELPFEPPPDLPVWYEGEAAPER
jgi:PPIC-type PPIASE domain